LWYTIDNLVDRSCCSTRYRECLEKRQSSSNLKTPVKRAEKDDVKGFGIVSIMSGAVIQYQFNSVPGIATTIILKNYYQRSIILY